MRQCFSIAGSCAHVNVLYVLIISMWFSSRLSGVLSPTLPQSISVGALKFAL